MIYHNFGAKKLKIVCKWFMVNELFSLFAIEFKMTGLCQLFFRLLLGFGG